MATKNHTLTRDAWTKLTDGTNRASLQVFQGGIEVIDSPTEPDGSIQGFVLKCCYNNGMYYITPPTVAWARAGTSAPVKIAVIM